MSASLCSFFRVTSGLCHILQGRSVLANKNVSSSYTFMSVTWTCSLCSVKNDRSLVVCSFCQATPDEKVEMTPPKEKKRKHNEIAPPSRESSNPLFVWDCKTCTLVNPFRLSACDGCGTLRFPGNVDDTDDVKIVAHVNASPPDAKRPKLAEVESIPPLEPEAADGRWACRFCTYLNEPGHAECHCCESAKESLTSSLSSGGLQRRTSSLGTSEMAIVIDEESSSAPNDLEIEEVPADLKTLNRTLSKEFVDTLKGSCAQCPICGCEFELEDIESLTEHASLHVSGDSKDFRVSVVSPSDATSNYGNASSSSSSRRQGQIAPQIDTIRFTTAYEHQYARSYTRSFSAVKTIDELQIHMNEVTRNLLIAADSATCDGYVVSALHEHYRLFPSASKKVALATHVKHFSSGHGDRGWGCGYRNIQMLASSLLELPHFKELLFGGIGHIPTIPVLQQCLEAAWSDGFDPGSATRNEGVFGGNRWIGTYDAVSVLRAFGVHVEMQTFGAKLRPGAKDKANNNARGSLPGNVVTLSSFTYRRYQPAMYVPHAAMFDWVWKYFDSRKTRGDRVIPPLYLQHDGHSRTIVGAENVNGRIALLIFDPSFPPKDASYRLRNEVTVPDVLRKTLSEFRHQNYQIAYVADTTKPIAVKNRKHFKSIVQPPFIQS